MSRLSKIIVVLHIVCIAIAILCTVASHHYDGNVFVCVMATISIMTSMHKTTCMEQFPPNIQKELSGILIKVGLIAIFIFIWERVGLGIFIFLFPAAIILAGMVIGTIVNLLGQLVYYLLLYKKPVSEKAGDVLDHVSNTDIDEERAKVLIEAAKKSSKSYEEIMQLIENEEK